MQLNRVVLKIKHKLNTVGTGIRVEGEEWVEGGSRMGTGREKDR